MRSAPMSDCPRPVSWPPISRSPPARSPRRIGPSRPRSWSSPASARGPGSATGCRGALLRRPGGTPPGDHRPPRGTRSRRRDPGAAHDVVSPALAAHGRLARPSPRPIRRPMPDPTEPTPATTPSETREARRTRERDGTPWGSILRNIALVLTLVTMLWLAFNVRLPDLGTLQADIAGLGMWGVAAFVVLYALVALTPIPVTIMAVTGGLVFGIPVGTALSMIG